MELNIQQIPEEHRQGLTSLANLSGKAVDDLAEILQGSPPVLVLSELVEKVITKTEHNELDSSSVEDILSILLSLSLLREDAELSIADVATGVREAAEEDELLPLNERQLEHIEDRLSILLNASSTIEDSYKAGITVSDHEHVFSNARIFTDLRPVFKEDPSEKPLTIGVVHNLKLQYSELSGPNELFVALDSEDLIRLKEEVKRAINKEKTIRAVFSHANVPFLGKETEAQAAKDNI